MSQKADLYNALKASGAQLTTTYARYTVDELQAELALAGTVVTKEAVPPFWRNIPFLGRLLPSR